MVALVNVSSLYPIDLTACVYAGADQGIKTLITVNDSARITQVPENRKFEARRSLPSISWALDTKGD